MPSVASGDVNVNSSFFASASGFKEFHETADHFVEIRALKFIFHFPFLNLAHVEQRVDKRDEVVGRVLDFSDRFFYRITD